MEKKFAPRNGVCVCVCRGRGGFPFHFKAFPYGPEKGRFYRTKRTQR